jgi:RNA polymerase sigma-70 factor (ECF subfamily)
MIGQCCDAPASRTASLCAGRRNTRFAPTESLSESEAIRRAQRGDGRGFERLYHLHKRRVHAICLRMVANPSEAEDLTQEAFLQVFRKISTFQWKSAFSTWLHRLAFNVVLMELRQKKFREVPLDENAEPQNDSASPGKETASVDASLTGLIDRVHLERAVRKLPASHKMVFVLHDVQGYKHQEIARMMDCSVQTSKVQLHRARMRLRKLLHNR